MNRTDNTTRKRVHVAVGVIYSADGRILVAQRAANQHLGGLWEFPGGKVEAGESVKEALARELQEELGIHVLTQTPSCGVSLSGMTPLCKVQHDYTDKSVMLDVWAVTAFDGEPHGREGQPLRWLKPDELRYEDFPEANRAIIRAIGLPDYLAILSTESDPQNLKKTSAHLPQISLIRLRQSGWPYSTDLQKNTSRQQILDALPLCSRRVIVDLADAEDQFWQTLAGTHGVHANRHVLRQLTQRPVPEHLLFGASCHDAEELVMAAGLGADYALLSPVLTSSSHPEQKGMGWENFEKLATSVDIAVYAMGGLQQTDLSAAKACGARGIAGIRLFTGL